MRCFHPHTFWLRGMIVLVGCSRSSADPDKKGVASGAFFGTPLPGALGLPPSLVAKIKAAWATRDPNYKPRTAHLKADGSPKYTNRLFLEPSPYLRQHGHNPLNWYPWGDEAFEAATKLGRPVLLSAGYSPCPRCPLLQQEPSHNSQHP